MSRTRRPASIPTCCWPPRNNARWTASSSSPWPPRRGPGPGRLGAAERRGAGAHGDRHRLRGGRLPCHRRSGADHRRQGTAPPVALHHPVLSLQHGGRPCVDPPWLQGTAGRPGDRLRGGRAGHRRRGADDPRGRGRRGALRRRGSDHPPGQPGRLRRRARPVQRFQRQPRARLAPLRPGPRRLRHGRRRRPTGHRGTGARPGARRQAHRRGWWATAPAPTPTT